VFRGNGTCAGGSNPNNKNGRNGRQNKRLIKDARNHRQSERARWECCRRRLTSGPGTRRKACWIWLGGSGGMGPIAHEEGRCRIARVLGVTRAL